jgi:nucleoside-diphosphate-sugar epimerase
MNSNTLVTGGSGFIGSHIVTALAKMLESTIITYDMQAENNHARNTISIQGDIFDRDKLVKVIQDNDVQEIIHMVGLGSVPECKKSPDLSYRLNLSSVHSVLEAMRLSGADRLVFPSTAVVYGSVKERKVNEKTQPKPTTVYGCHKLAAESLINGYSDTYGLKPTIFRIFNVYGDLEKEQGVVSIFIKKALAQQPIIINGGKQLRDFVHLNDVIKAFTGSLNNKKTYGKTLNIGSGIGIPIKEVALMVKQAFPNIPVTQKKPTSKDHSYHADISRIKRILKLNPVNPRKGIPQFIKECRTTR